jgi:hypothetical protein
VQLNKTTKDHVLDILGLPHKCEAKLTDEGKKIEYWIYYSGRGKSCTTYHIPLPFAAVPVSVVEIIPVYGLNISEEEAKNVGLILVFNDRGVVIESLKQESKNEPH